MTFTIKKSTIFFWVVMLILQVVVIAHMRGLITVPIRVIPTPAPVADITQVEAERVLSAIGIVRKDMNNGALDTVEAVSDALGANVPIRIREQIVKAFGTPDKDKIQESLDDLENKIKKLL